MFTWSQQYRDSNGGKKSNVCDLTTYLCLYDLQIIKDKQITIWSKVTMTSENTFMPIT